MDDRLKKALEFSNYRISLFNRKEDLKLAMQQQLTYAHNGGIFRIDQSLIAFVKLFIDQDLERNLVLIDSNGNPIEIKDKDEFYQNIVARYFEATNLYHYEYTKLKAARTVSSIYDFVGEE
jgi:hypothetical protein